MYGHYTRKPKFSKEDLSLFKPPSHGVFIAHPSFDLDQRPSGWFVCEDEYMNPQVIYTAEPLLTTIKLGGRSITVRKATTVKICTSLTGDNFASWNDKPHLSQRTYLGEYHRDFIDVWVAYSSSFPRTHILINNYSIHLAMPEVLTIASENAVLHTRPDERKPQSDADQLCPLPPDVLPKPLNKSSDAFHRDDIRTPRDDVGRNHPTDVRLHPSRHPSQQPPYSLHIPCVKESTINNCTYPVQLEYEPVTQVLNTEYSQMRVIDAFNVELTMASKSAPFCHRPTTLQPFGDPQFIFRSRTPQ